VCKNKKRITILSLIFVLVLFSGISQVAIADKITSVSQNSTSNMPEFECLIQPDMVVNITSPTIGILDSINVDNSDYVKKGDVLALLDSGVQKASADIAKAQADRRDEVQLRETDLAFAKRKLARITELLEKNSVSPLEKDEAETAVALAELELQKAQNENELARLEYEKARQVLERRTIRSPIDGIIVYKSAFPGELTEDKPIFTIAKINPLRVELIVPVKYFGLIKTGMKTFVMPEIESEFKHSATVTMVDKVIDAASGTFNVRLSLPNPEQKIPSGLKCQARFL
jgi:RND family efflux transporter MFP subunit